MPNKLPAKNKLPELSGWGRYPRVEQTVVRPEKTAQLAYQNGKTLARGQGRSYGDAALNSAGVVLLTERLNRFLEFDESTGVLKAEAGATLERVLEAMVPRGWFLPVTLLDVLLVNEFRRPLTSLFTLESRELSVPITELSLLPFATVFAVPAAKLFDALSREFPVPVTTFWLL